MKEKVNVVIRTSADKIPYFTRMLVGGVAMCIIGAISFDVWSAETVSSALTIPGGILAFVGLIGRVVCLLDAN